jgi:hypothetical protein
MFGFEQDSTLLVDAVQNPPNDVLALEGLVQLQSGRLPSKPLVVTRVVEGALQTGRTDFEAVLARNDVRHVECG